VAFSQSRGDNDQSFLGFVSAEPFQPVDVYFTWLQTGQDGSAIDDLCYALAPTPVPAMDGSMRVLLIGLLLVGVCGLMAVHRTRRAVVASMRGPE
jgi:hypothetical protein